LTVASFLISESEKQIPINYYIHLPASFHVKTLLPQNYYIHHKYEIFATPRALRWERKQKKKKGSVANIPRIRRFRVKAWLCLNEEHRWFVLRYHPQLSRELLPATLSTHNFALFPNQSSSSTPSPATTPFLRQTPSSVAVNPRPTLLFSPTKKIFRNKSCEITWGEELYSVSKNVNLVDEWLMEALSTGAWRCGLADAKVCSYCFSRNGHAFGLFQNSSASQSLYTTKYYTIRLNHVPLITLSYFKS